MSKKLPSVCSIILNWNTKELTFQALKSLRNNNYSGPNTRLIIDNASTDGSEVFFKKKLTEDEHLIVNPQNLGYASGFNVGFEFAIDKGFDYVLVMNSDCIVSKSTVAELVQVAESDENIGYVTGKTYYYNKPNFLQIIGKDYDKNSIIGKLHGKDVLDTGQYDKVRDFFLIDDIYMLINSRAIKKTKGYDSNFFLQYEEADMLMRAKKWGFRCMYTPFAKAWHRVSISTGGNSSPLRVFYSQRNKLVFCNRHLPSNIKIFYFIKEFFYNLPISLISYIVKGNTEISFALLKGSLSGLSNIIGD